MTPVVTMMIGRLDDWIAVLVHARSRARRPGLPALGRDRVLQEGLRGSSGERGYRARLLAAAYRHQLHWTELVGGDVVLTMPHAWQRLFNESGFEVVPRMDEPVPEPIVDELYERLRRTSAAPTTSTG